MSTVYLQLTAEILPAGSKAFHPAMSNALSDCIAVYCPELDLAAYMKDREGPFLEALLDENDATTKEVFTIVCANEVEDFSYQGSWALEHMDNSGGEDWELAMPDIWKAVKDRLDENVGQYAEFLTSWRVSESQDWESGYNEVDSIEFEGLCVVHTVDDFERMANKLQELRQALKNADEGIQKGQACRSEAEFTKWMREVSSHRPHADLIEGAL